MFCQYKNKSNQDYNLPPWLATPIFSRDQGMDAIDRAQLAMGAMNGDPTNLSAQK